MDFSVSADHRVKIKESEKKVLRPFQRTEKDVEHESDGDTNCERSPKAWKGDEWIYYVTSQFLGIELLLKTYFKKLEKNDKFSSQKLFSWR